MGWVYLCVVKKRMADIPKCHIRIMNVLIDI